MATTKEPIAIIGSGCRFPGGSSSPSKLWNLLRNPRDVLREFPEDRLRLPNFYNKNGEHHGSTDVKNKGYLLAEDDAHRVFDAPFFNINPLEAEGMDPAQRILLEVVYEALESAGYTIEEMQGTLTSVYVGLMTADWWDLQMRDTETIATYAATGTARSIISNRISYYFDLKGASMTIDTACSSSLVALHQAVQSLRNGESTTAIVAGANMLLDPAMYIAESNLHMLSPESRSRMWDKSADGYARGEGCAAVFLKPLSKAIADGDHIECVVRETGVNSDGRTKGITMPSATAQAALIKATYRNAGLDPLVDRCQYFECHGTGTAAGDPIEAQAISEAFFPHGESNDRMYVGSIKTVVGHLEGCAGLAGLLKASLAVQNGTVPPNMLFNELNPAIEPYYKNLRILQSSIPWPEVEGPRRASVNSFGFGGTNAHAIIENYEPERNAEAPARDHFRGPLVFSARSESSILSSIREYAQYIKSNPAVDLEDLAWVLQEKRGTFPVKHFFSGSNRDRLLSFMDSFLETADSGSVSSLVTRAQLRYPDEVPGILGVFTGQGAQWATMGTALIQRCKLFRESIERSEAALAALPDPPAWSLKAELLAGKDTSRIAEAALSQPLCTALQIAMVDLVTASGVKLDAAVGHSSGEIAAVYAAGIISAADAMAIAYYRGFHAKLAQGRDGKKGGMMAVGLSYEAALTFCAQYDGRISLAASNSPSSVTLSGDLDAIEEAKAYFDEQKTFARQLQVDTAYHSYHMLPCAEPYLKSLKACNIKINRPRSDRACVWSSSVRADTELLEGDLEALTGQYWVDNMVQPVLFSQALECSLWNGGPFEMVVELGPHPALKGPGTQVLKSVLGSAPPYMGFMRRGDDEVEAFSGGLGFLWSSLGPSFVDFDGYRNAFSDSKPKMLKDLPSYAWDHEKTYWKEGRISRNYRLRKSTPHELLGRRVPDDSDYEMRWRNIVRLNEMPWIRGHEFQGQVLFPAAAYVAMALEASKTLAGDRPVRLFELRDISIRKALVMDEGSSGVETVFTVKLLNTEFGTGAKDVLEAEFSGYTCADEAAGVLEKTACGRILVHLGERDGNELPPVTPARPHLAPVDLERFYSSIAKLGLNYQGLFQGLTHAERTLGYSRAAATWKEHGMGADYIVHPAFLDVVFQAIFVALTSPATTGALWTPYLPIALHRIVVDPSQVHDYSIPEVKAEMDAFITQASSSSVTGDVQLLNPAGTHTSILVEGLFLKSISEPTPATDRLLFSQTVWDADIASGPVDVDEGEEDSEEREMIHAIERLALFHFRNLVDTIPAEEVKTFTWYHQRLFEAIHANLDAIRGGQNSVIEQAWLSDTRETIDGLRAKFPGQIDLELMHAISENLVSVVRGETQILEVMLENDMLNRFYMEGRGFRKLNDYIARVVQQISHKHPRAKILEIGAGTGGTTRNIFDTIGSTYSSYTYTDISSGFFEKAAEKFHDHVNKMTFKVLDIEKDVSQQGYEEGGYDVIIAANVLHATRNLAETMQHTRALLKPGGYFILMEVTGDLLRNPFVMGALPGWWLGAEEGRRLSPGISTVEWDELMQSTGFSGVNAVLHDFPDPTRHSCSVMISQAVDDKFSLLREPLSAVNTFSEEDQNLLIIGGKTLAVSKLVRDTQKLLSPWKKRTTVVASIDALDIEKLAPRTSVICLTELDKPLFLETMSQARLTKLQELFISAKSVLWITSGCHRESPISNMAVGIGRALITELPHLTLQFVDAKVSSLTPTLLVESLLRLIMAGSPEFSEHKMLWATEPEVKIDGDTVLIPRIVPDKAINDRFNASRRQVNKQVKKEQARVEVVASGPEGPLTLVEATATADDEKSVVDVKFSTAIGKDCTLSLGSVSGSPALALVASDANTSSVTVTEANILSIPDGPQAAPDTLLDVASHVLAIELLKPISPHSSALVYEPSERLAAALTYHAKAKDINLVFTTTEMARAKNGWLSLHPQATERALRNLIPRNTACLIHFGSKAITTLASILPRDAPTYVFDLVNGAIPLPDKETLSAAFDAAVAASLGNSDASTVSVQALTGAPPAQKAYPNVVDWTEPELTVTVRPLNPAGLFRSDKTYLMVGMTGEMGRSLCRWMVTHGARYIVLTSRSAHVDAAWLEEMSTLGATVKVYKMDVSDRGSVRSVHAAICQDLPPIAGVCNAAMVLIDKLFVDMSAENVNDVLGPKVEGSKILDEVFNENGPDLDFFVLFSSLASIFGNAGQSNYHAANLFMTSLAAQRRSRGLAASVMHIGMVADVGYVARTGRHIEDHLRKLLFHPMSETDVQHLFAEAVRSSRPEADGNWSIVSGIEPFLDTPDAQSKPPFYSNPRFAHCIHEENTAKEQKQSGAAAKDIKQQLEAAGSEEDAAAAIQEAFAAKLEMMLQMAPNTVNVNVPLLDLGTDSLLAVEIRTWFLKTIHVDIPVLKVLSGDTVGAICTDAARKYLATRPAKETKSAPATGEPLANGLEENESKKTAEEQVPRNRSPAVSVAESDSSSAKDESLAPEAPSSKTSDTTRSTTPSSGDTLTPAELSSSVSISRVSTPVSDLSDATPPPTRELTFKRKGKLSHAQSRLFFLKTFVEDPTTYNCTALYQVQGDLKVMRLRRALAEVIAQHESLRTAFYADPATGEPTQGIFASQPNCLKVVENADEDTVKHEFNLLKNTAWDLEQGITFGATVVSQSSGVHSIIFGYHHIIMDGVSWFLFLRDLARAYALQPLSPVTKQYVDFTQEQTKSIEEGKLADSISFWKTEFAQLPEPTPLLPISRLKARWGAGSYRSHNISREVDATSNARIKDASRALGVSPFHLHMATIQALFAKFLGVNDLCIGVSDANRTDDNLSDTVGFFLNLLPVRFSIDHSKPFSELAKRTSKKIFTALAHSSVPFDLILDELNVARSQSYSPLFQIGVNYRMNDLLTLPFGDCELLFKAAEDARNPYDLSFNITQSASGSCLLDVSCREDLYTAEAGEVLMDTYVHLLKSFSEDTTLTVDSCSLFDKDTVTQDALVGKGPRISPEWPETLTERFQTMAQNHADAIAINDESGKTTYQQLANKADKIAAHLLEQGIESGSAIAVLCQPSSDLIACMLAIIRINCVYVPLDLSLPQVRHVAMLDSCMPALVLSDTHTLKRAQSTAGDLRTINVSELPEIDASSIRDLPLPNPSSAAFLLFTSGTTGTPKGIRIPQRGHVNHCEVVSRAISVTAQDSIMLQASFGFDVSLVEIFVPLWNGGTAVIVPQAARGDPVAIVELMQKAKVTLTLATPSEYAMILESGSQSLKACSEWRHAITGGEPITERMKQAFRALGRPGLTLSNWYGPTECSVACTFEHVDLASTTSATVGEYTSIGKPLPNCSVYILDPAGSPLPVGIPGEICIGGAGVVLGYVNLPEQTAAKFCPDPFAGPEDVTKGWTTLYKTGDKGRLQKDGSVVFMGRIDGDTQVKLRGLRIELDDVENALLKAAPAHLSSAVVSVRGDPEMLVAHVVFVPGKTLGSSELQQLAANLPVPQYMRPALVIPLERLPVTANAKVDRNAVQALPLPELTAEVSGNESLTLSQSRLARLWKGILPKGVLLDPTSDFFIAGGNSLLLVKLQRAIKEEYGLSLRITKLYTASTLESMTNLVASCEEEQPRDEQIDWEAETEVPESTTLIPKPPSERRRLRDQDKQILLTGALSFFGSTLLTSLLADPRIAKIHLLAIDPDAAAQSALPTSPKLTVYPGALAHPTLGLSPTDITTLQSTIDLIIHAGSFGHCMHNYSSVRPHNVGATRFIAEQLALPHLVPIHFLSSNRVPLLGGGSADGTTDAAAVPPHLHPPADGSEGLTASKWACERVLAALAARTGLSVRVHRACALVGDGAPADDALNALLRYSALLRAVPRFERFVGYFDYRDVGEVAGEFKEVALGGGGGGGDDGEVLAFYHHSSGRKVPVMELRRHLEEREGVAFEEVEVAEWIERAKERGIEVLVTNYLEMVLGRGERMVFPYLGETESQG
ncbi:Beta-ketoacyl synthase [Lasiodiplodia theobromae]|uniref:Beta-ketoacyl synthase n=1 Tax=Lasiodiplodia theobromae TaxID=45133 RepID=UPI0015C2D428|nr:Beta-ketoacyl synthase [Lasiodiplodia theobromae]KAF4539201.1 Beta-ketoacyl synthase [Lasiodiplodia theobromae]